MKIGLVAILGGDLVRSAEHVGLGLIAAFLRNKGYQVRIIEIRNGEKETEFKELFAEAFDVIGFTTTCITLGYVLNAAEAIKKKRNWVKIVLGGHMATFSGEDILRCFPQVDYIIAGEGEITFYELAKTLANRTSLKNVKGLIYRENGQVIKNPGRELIENLDDLPFAARDQFLQNQKSTQYIRISTSRGCYGGCAFCSSFVGRKQEGPRWRGRSPMNVVDEIEMLVRTYRFHTFDFIDSTFEDPGEEGKQRIACIAREVIKRDLNIYYNCCFRAENWKDTDRELLSLLVESGLEKVNIGFESGNDRGLTILNKKARLADNRKALEVLSDFPDIYVTFGFIMLHPYSTKEDLKDNAGFLYATGIGQVIRHYFWQLEVYPGTLMEQRLVQDQLLTKEYNLTDGMYEYRFLNPDVKPFASLFQEMLSLKSVWDFEIFDIMIHTFISRLRRVYAETDTFLLIEKFRIFVNEEREKIAGFNYEFFMRMFENPEAYPVEQEKALLDCFIKDKMKHIQTEQYKLGRKLLKTGRKLINR